MAVRRHVRTSLSVRKLAVVYLLLLVELTLSTRASTTSRSSLLAPPISLKHGLNKFVSARWQKANELSELEQQVEDYNAEWIATSNGQAQSTRHRRLICLPLSDRFDPPMGSFSHKHVQTGDKMSLPANFWQAIQLNHAEVPWLFSVKRIDGVTGERVELSDDDIITPHKPLAQLDKVVGGPLDFRAPACYIFLPWWMMRALGVKPRDIVEVELFETVPAGSLAKLRPHSSDFGKEIANPQAVLETELRHYSSLTQGSTIAFDYNKKRYWFDVVELRSAPRGEKSSMVKVQDCDIATDFLIARDEIQNRRRRKQEREQDRE